MCSFLSATAAAAAAPGQAQYDPWVSSSLSLSPSLDKINEMEFQLQLQHVVDNALKCLQSI